MMVGSWGHGHGFGGCKIIQFCLGGGLFPVNKVL